MLIEELPQTAIISVGHRSSLLQYHEQRLELLGEGRWRLGPLTLPGASPLQPQPA
jgi:putative ATP-binding cassette transporter